MAESYGRFAEVYDKLIRSDISYGDIADFAEKYVSSDGGDAPIVLDLGCGTGSLTKIMSDRGYDMIGVDVSQEMLNIAKQKDEKSLYLCQDMREFELYGTVDAIVCATDCINYITDASELDEVFRLAKNYLNPSAPFIFDISSLYKLKNILGNNTYTYDDDGIFYVWENEFDEDERICDLYLTFFCEKDGVYHRFDEAQSQKVYEPSQIEQALVGAGFSSIEIYGGYKGEKAAADSERLVFVAR